MGENYSDAFLKAWNARPWLLEKESDKDRAWRWWQAAKAAPDEPHHNIPFHEETMAGLDALSIRKRS
ncbi:hypothetical protein [Bradyrhizobium icense]|uniref:Uncharacterized protein n=1 Tax=Bradyrhizobium icense TaxID=1274631 RepID=A0A1B1UD78_9BRAD|nr:hypothetical protein [Bradyrhizobium icense]ANW00708.1 hypothetical protein LMTR13_11520 [Bradyrhizobium icense]